MGFLGKTGVLTWCFCGECVAVCVVKVVRRLSLFVDRISAIDCGFIFEDSFVKKQFGDVLLSI
jgi:hypothetical protein